MREMPPNNACPSDISEKNNLLFVVCLSLTVQPADCFSVSFLLTSVMFPERFSTGCGEDKKGWGMKSWLSWM